MIGITSYSIMFWSPTAPRWDYTWYNCFINEDKFSYQRKLHRQILTIYIYFTYNFLSYCSVPIWKPAQLSSLYLNRKRAKFGICRHLCLNFLMRCYSHTVPQPIFISWKSKYMSVQSLSLPLKNEFLGLFPL